MTFNPIPPRLPAPCIIDRGILVNQDDMKRLLNSLGKVHYHHFLGGVCQSSGDGWILEVFISDHQATLVMNQSLHINVCSFDYLELGQNNQQEITVTLVQDNRRLELIPLTGPSPSHAQQTTLDMSSLEAMMTRVLSARWDVQLDLDDDLF